MCSRESGSAIPIWRPTPFLAQGVEGQIRGIEGEAREAQARFFELQRAGIGPGRFAGESIPARGPERDFRSEERREINASAGIPAAILAEQQRLVHSEITS
jgi:hypothetical protein